MVHRVGMLRHLYPSTNPLDCDTACIDEHTATRMLPRTLGCIQQD
jgi:hypothetical protein